LSVIFATIIINVVVDPYGIFNLVSIEGFNKNKTKITTDQIPRFYNAKRQNPDTMLFGTSRIGSISPSIVEKFTSDRVYNFSLAGSSIQVQSSYIDYFVNSYDLKNIIIGLDFFSFRDQPKRVWTEEIERTSGSFVDDYLLALLNKKTIINSINTIKDNFNGRYVVTDYSTGENIYEEYREKFDNSGLSYTQSMIKRTINDYSRDNYKDSFYSFEQISKNVTVLENLVRYAQSKNINVKIYINPTYCLQFALIKYNNLEDKYLYWKNELTRVMDYYDFSGCNSVTDNPIFWYDSSHYKSEVAQRIVDTIFTKKSTDGFGFYVDSNNVAHYNRDLFEQVDKDKIVKLERILNIRE
jgi:hypothetical protein